ncbi:MAG: LamG domain-containing protein, partial [Solirubrobacteraceae bacterium]
PAPAPAPPPAPAPATNGLVASFGFNETSGQTIVDASPSANNGTVSGAARSSAGKHERALSFDGVNDYASVPDATPLDLTRAMTLEAWVYPTSGGNRWRTAVLKETVGGLAYALYAFDDQGHPAGVLNTGTELIANGSSALALKRWSHISTTWDGTTQRLYVNGALITSRPASSSLLTSGRPLKIGGNAVWGTEFFKGMIDDVRVYDRMLSASEINADMNTSA